MQVSFRDPAGSVFVFDDVVLRGVNKGAREDLFTFLKSTTMEKLAAQQQIVRTQLVDDKRIATLSQNPDVGGFLKRTAASYDMLVEHERIWFQSFPYEWSPAMLHAAGALTLELTDLLLEEGLGLKDATPYNILFRGPTPVFVDLLSFEHRDPKDPIWLARAQFIRTFLLPLLVNRYFGLPLATTLLSHRDGLEPSEVAPLCGPIQKFLPPFLTLVTIPARLSAKAAKQTGPSNTLYQAHKVDDPEKSKFIFRSMMGGLKRGLRKLTPPVQQDSTWSDYMKTHSYSTDAFDKKQDFVTRAVDEMKPKRVLDVGCNTGHFSAIAARKGAEVVAIDYDPVVIDQVWKNASAEKLNILPLVVNLARPTPSMGWLNKEAPAFLDRARGKFDMVFMLAVVHHMLVTERIPLDQIIDLAADLTTGGLVLEYIAPNDSAFRTITRGRDHLFTWLTLDSFEQACRRRFDVVKKEQDHETRWIFLLRKK